MSLSIKDKVTHVIFDLDGLLLGKTKRHPCLSIASCCTQ